jgi:hypothetical protein
MSACTVYKRELARKKDILAYSIVYILCTDGPDLLAASSLLYFNENLHDILDTEIVTISLNFLLRLLMIL